MLVRATANLPGFQLMTGQEAEVNGNDPEVRRAIELGTLQQVGGPTDSYDTATQTENPKPRRSGCRGCGG